MLDQYLFSKVFSMSLRMVVLSSLFFNGGLENNIDTPLLQDPPFPAGGLHSDLSSVTVHKDFSASLYTV
jgi:hypothetical protein